jgi:hypothetical protein
VSTSASLAQSKSLEDDRLIGVQDVIVLNDESAKRAFRFGS